MVFDLYGREVFVGDPNVASVQSCAGRDTFGFEASDVEIVGDCSFGC
jgi:hypothetical protein